MVLCSFWDSYFYMIIGFTTIFTLNVYAHTSEQRMMDAASQMQGYYDGLKKGQIPVKGK